MNPGFGATASTPGVVTTTYVSIGAVAFIALGALAVGAVGGYLVGHKPRKRLANGEKRRLKS